MPDAVPAKRRGRPPKAPEDRKVKYDARFPPLVVEALREFGTDWVEEVVLKELRRRRRPSA